MYSLYTSHCTHYIFPVKVTVPLLLSINAIVTFQKFSRDPAAPALFDVPAEYRKVSLKPPPKAPQEKAPAKKKGGKPKKILPPKK
jgi:hypothetical protein